MRFLVPCFCLLTTCSLNIHAQRSPEDIRQQIDVILARMDTGQAHAQAVAQAARSADVIVLCLGEEAYTEKPGDINDLQTHDHKGTEQVSPVKGLNAYQPQWPFGHGLTYTAFAYDSLKLSAPMRQNQWITEPGAFTILVGGLAHEFHYQPQR